MAANRGNGIDTSTVMFGVFGDPVAHSKSPLMLNRAFEVTGANAAYAAFHIRPGTLRDAVNGIRALGFRGVNVTIPHKLEVVDYLDEIDEHARAIGAVNTIVNDQGRLKGYNTDGIGYVRSLKEEAGFSIAGQTVMLLGAGGAARGIGYALAKEGAARIIIANRTASKAEELAAYLSEGTDTEGIGLEAVATRIDGVNLVVNTTKIGMHPKIEECPIAPELIHPGMLVSDIVYNPLETRFLREAKARGAAVHGGLGMFIYQGAYAFEYWTGQPAPAEAMREIVERSLTEAAL
ncbi:shikimate dehydrogenase [Paenibacillus sp. J2TS4]|uniref:shikimate dehydrogenase n=1 Tax=Paenibacillus sp. J2TS4 TaxID=2807194 RepID=UPI001B2EDB63|nr:shikimate dehydrogenase [Paenibacillus sp. J2TS4]GIP35890.1 shikimate dehydrogenase (NADP(+)) [Paenibacillus sp. J2TS4]